MKRFEDYGFKNIDYKKTDEQYSVCPKCSANRKPANRKIKCVTINIVKGVFHCHHCGYAGSLYEKAAGHFEPRPIKVKPIPLSEKVYIHLAERKISRAVIDRNKITMDSRVFGNKNYNCICFNYFYNNELVNIKYRSPFKDFQQVKDGQKIFYKLDDIKETDEVIITEGEFDALSFEEAGFLNAVSVPEGAINTNVKELTNKMLYLDNCYDYFENKKKIYLAVDNDAPGIRLRDELARRLGKSRCYIINYPPDCKDANDVLMKHGKDELKSCFNEAISYPVEGIYYAYSRENELYELYEHGFPDGAKIGYHKFDDLFEFHSSQLTIVTGIPSHGKSNFIDEVMLRLAVKHGWKFGVFSPENATIEIHLLRLCEILIGKPFLKYYNNRMSIEELHQALDFIHKHIFFILPDNENYKLDNILECASNLCLKYGIKGLIIDPWNTIEHQKNNGEETHIYIGRVLNQLKYYSRLHGLHTLLVAHPKKMQRAKETQQHLIPTLYDISDSANWYNVADNGIVIYRKFGEDKSSNYNEVHVQKVKHKFIGKIGYCKFNFDVSCQRFIEFGAAKKDSMFEYQEDSYFVENSIEDEESF
jgi:twinkle protein